MKKTRTASPASPASTAALAALAALGIDVSALAALIPEAATEAATEAAPEAAPKAAPRKRNAAPAEYEATFLAGSDFTQSLYAAPKSPVASEYFAQAAALAGAVLHDLSEMAGKPAITDALALAAGRIEAAPDKALDEVLALADAYDIPARAMRVVIQLLCPVCCVCCDDTDKIARRVYALGRANALMGSVHNGLMYSKAADKSQALPFVRVCRNYSRLGLDFIPAESVDRCEWVMDQEPYNALLTLCHYWLNQCSPKVATAPATVAAAPAAPVARRRVKVAAAPATATVAAAPAAPMRIRKEWAEADDLPTPRRRVKAAAPAAPAAPAPVLDEKTVALLKALGVIK